jgi:hypothetical protein
MPECHKCDHAANLAAFMHKAFTSTPCASCRLSENVNHHGRSHVSIDAAPGYAQACLDPEVQESEPQEQETIDDALSHLAPLFISDDEAVDALSKAATVLRELLRLPARRRGIVMDHLANPEVKIKDLAKSIGLTPQAVQQSIQEAERKIPALRHAFTSHRRNQGGIDTPHSGHAVENPASPQAL